MTGRKKYRKGVVVYAQKDIEHDDLFPTSTAKVIHIDIPKGTKGRVTDASDKDLPRVKFEGQPTDWAVTTDLIDRKK